MEVNPRTDFDYFHGIKFFSFHDEHFIFTTHRTCIPFVGILTYLHIQEKNKFRN